MFAGNLNRESPHTNEASRQQQTQHTQTQKCWTICSLSNGNIISIWQCRKSMRGRERKLFVCGVAATLLPDTVYLLSPPPPCRRRCKCEYAIAEMICFFPFYFYLITTLLITQNVWIECSLQIGWEHNGFDDISLSLWAIKKCIKVDNELFIPFTPWMNETETLKSMPAFFLISETIKKTNI